MVFKSIKRLFSFGQFFDNEKSSLLLRFPPLAVIFSLTLRKTTRSRTLHFEKCSTVGLSREKYHIGSESQLKTAVLSLTLPSIIEIM